MPQSSTSPQGPAHSPPDHTPSDIAYVRSIPTVPANDYTRRLARRSVSHFDGSRISPGAIPSIAGATAGFVSGVFTCPLDVIKTKLQAQSSWIPPHELGSGRMPELRYRGLLGTFRLIWSEEGLRGMYRGLGPLIMGFLPTWTVYFTVYEKSKKTLEPMMESKSLSHLISAICGGASSTLCTNPIWVIKTRLMSQTATTASTTPSPYHYRSTIDAARKMYTHEGLRSFYSGLAPALLGLTHVGVQFPAYEFLKGKFTGGIELGKQGADGSSHWGGILAASILSKVCATSATYPHEVLRTRLQTQRILNGHAEKSGVRQESSVPRYRGILHSAGTIYREEGWRAFYSGMGTNMVRAVPSSAITLLTYELVNGFLKRLREESIDYHGHR